MPEDPHGKLTAKEDWNVGEMLTADWANTAAHLANRNAAKPYNMGSMQRALSIGAGNFSSSDIPDIGIQFYNADAQQIPSYGVVLITSGFAVPGGMYPSCQQPNVYGCQYNALLNGDGIVSATSLGYAQFPYRPMKALYDSGDGTPVFGQMWGPRSGTYKLKANTGGFFVIGVYDSTNNLALVVPAPMLSVRGSIPSDLAPQASTTLTVWVGSRGSESNTSQTVTGVYNGSDCTLKSAAPRLHRAVWDWDILGWEFDVGRTA